MTKPWKKLPSHIYLTKLETADLAESSFVAADVHHLTFRMKNRLTALAGLLLLTPIALCAQQSSPVPPAPPQPGQLNRLLPNTIAASPLSVSEKFNYRVIESLGYKGFLGSALSAGLSQWDDSPRRWGQGAEGYGLRYGSAFGTNVARQSFAWGLESAVHEDPRYFPSVDKQNRRQRLANAFRQVFITRKDSGEDGFAYSRIISAFGAGQFVNVWQPRGNNSPMNGLERGFISLGGDAIYNVLQEFFPFTRPNELKDHKSSAPTR